MCQKEPLTQSFLVFHLQRLVVTSGSEQLPFPLTSSKSHWQSHHLLSFAVTNRNFPELIHIISKENKGNYYGMKLVDTNP